MSILNVENLTHGFGDRAIFENVSFRLLKGEHIGLIGANGEGKSTFMNIINAGRRQNRVGKECKSRLSGPTCCVGKGNDHPRCAFLRIFLPF